MQLSVLQMELFINLAKIRQVIDGKFGWFFLSLYYYFFFFFLSARLINISQDVGVVLWTVFFFFNDIGDINIIL